MADDPFPNNGEEPVEQPTGRVRIVGAETAGRLAGTGEVPRVAWEPGDSRDEHSQAVTDPDVWSVDAESGVDADDGAMVEATVAESGVAEPDLPHWTEAPTGQVPAVLRRTDDSSSDDDPWSTLPAPTWREQQADWEAHEESFDPSVLAHEESRLGSLDDSGGSDRQPWAFDLPEAGGGAIDSGAEGGDEGGEWPSPAGAGGGAATGGDAVTRGDEETIMIPAVRSSPATSRAPVASGMPEEIETPDVSETPDGAFTSDILFRFDERVGGSERDASVQPGAEVTDAMGRHGLGDISGEGTGDDRGRAGKREKLASSTVAAPLSVEQEDAVAVEEKRGEKPPKHEEELRQKAQVAERRPPRTPRDGSTGRLPAERTGTRQPHRPGRPGAPVSRSDLDRGEDRSGRNVPVAVASGFVIGVIVLVFFKLGNLPSIIIVTAVVTLAAMEAFGAFRKANYHPATLLGLVATVALMVATYNRGQQAFLLVLALLVVFTMLWHLAGVDRRADPVLSTGSTLIVFCWIALFGSFGALLLNPAVFPDRHGIAFLLAAVVVGVAYDVGAWATGVWIGRRPMAPSVSPRKTWEGFIGGAVVAILVSVIVVHLIHPWTYGAAAALGIVVAIVSPIGDLSESLIKRHLGLKDMGRILPGHGGVLDRVDGLLFLMPATYYLVRALHLG